MAANREVNMGFPYGEDVPEYDRHVKQIPLVISLVEAAEMLGLSYTTLWRKARSGEFPSFKIGKRWVTTMDSVTNFLEDHRYAPEQQCRRETER